MKAFWRTISRLSSSRSSQKLMNLGMCSLQLPRQVFQSKLNQVLFQDLQLSTEVTSMTVKDGKVHDGSWARVGLELHCPIEVLIVCPTTEDIRIADVVDVNLGYRLAALDALLKEQAKVDAVVPVENGVKRSTGYQLLCLYKAQANKTLARHDFPIAAFVLFIN